MPHARESLVSGMFCEGRNCEYGRDGGTFQFAAIRSGRRLRRTYIGFNDPKRALSLAAHALQVVRLATDPRCLIEINAVAVIDGGGWVLGDVNTHDRLIREIAVGAHAAVVFVDYDRAPEAPFPIPLEEAYAATKYVAENGSNLDVDSSRLAVVGDSAGGNIAAAVTLLSKERRGPKISFQLLFYPVTDQNTDLALFWLGAKIKNYAVGSAPIAIWIRFTLHVAGAGVASFLQQRSPYLLSTTF
jgi:acetyl esterase/lipase